MEVSHFGHVEMLAYDEREQLSTLTLLRTTIVIRLSAAAVQVTNNLTFPKKIQESPTWYATAIMVTRYAMTEITANTTTSS